MIVIWKKLRIPTLALTSGSVLFVLGNVIFQPIHDVAANSKLIFPEKISLAQWQQIPSQPLPKLSKEDKDVILQSRYQYTQNNSQLDIEMRYVKVGDVPSLLRRYLDIVSRPAIRQQENVGFYAVGIKGKRAYLSTCIAPNGKTIFTYEQLQVHLPKQNNPQFWASWLLDKDFLPTKRCLWTHLSIPLANSVPETAHKTLENAWFSWYQQWLPQVPNI
jgi:cyanosortase A-associated protein